MYSILQITDTAVGVTSLAAGVLLALLTLVMAFVALGPYLPGGVGDELDTEIAQADDAEDADAADEA